MTGITSPEIWTKDKWKIVEHTLRVPPWYIEKLKSLEGFSPVAYKPKGESNIVAKLTIGYGHYGANHGDKISLEEAHALLLSDLEKVESSIDQVLPGFRYKVSLDRWCCIVDFVFNVGIGKFKRSTLYKLLAEDPNHTKAPWQFLRWVYSGKQRLKGLQNRRKFFFDIWIRNSNS